ncbi:helix-turn-helix transcriptional regulator [Xanthobacteraceae bacterium A53D]
MNATPPLTLRQWRLAQRMTARDLAAKLEISGAHLSNIEKGQRGASLDLAVRIEQATAGAVMPSSLARPNEAAQ